MKVINLHQEEKEVIELAVENNRHAQHKIYSKFFPKMLSVCRQYIKDLHQAEDIMITAFMKVFTNLKNFKQEGSFEGWIRRIMINDRRFRISSALRAPRCLTRGSTRSGMSARPLR
jgi:RNA polymerase sigma-70 factor (ECF subfamily)